MIERKWKLIGLYCTRMKKKKEKERRENDQRERDSLLFLCSLAISFLLLAAFDDPRHKAN